MGASSSPSTLSKVIQVLVGFTLSLTLLFAASKYIFEPRNQTRCEGMLNDGWWLGPNYTQWQPSGCMPHHFSSEEIASCLNHSRVLYIGDSIMREQFYSLTSFVRGIDKKGALHVDRKYDAPKYGLSFEFWWDPYINSTRTQALLNATDPDDRPSLLVMGSGTWYMRHLKEKYFDEWRKAVDRVFAAVEGSNRVADAVLFHPVQIPQFDLLNDVRRETITMDKIRVMNNYLKAKELITESSTPFAIPFSWNSIASSTVNVTHDGLHYLPAVTTVQATLALNYRCNDLIAKDFPMDHTCCYHYPTPAWYQNIFLLYFLIWIPVGFYVVSKGSTGFMRRFFPADFSVLGSLFIFGLGVTYMYFCDRTQLFGKAQKFFDPTSFGALMLATLLGGLVTLKSKKEGDLGLLNRAQTDEWKGWMQIIILVYHFLGASQTAGIYNAVRVLVAAYLFQTGYGHFFFFYKKGDFGIQRVLNVLVRLNLLTFVLQYVMNTDYLSYYFTPLVTFWFGVIWITMYIGNKANKIVWFVVAKIAVMAILTGTYIHLPGLLEGTFDILEVLFNIHWDAGEWRFRLALDAWIVYVGMLFALAFIKFNEHKLHEHSSWRIIKLIFVVASVAAMWWYFWFELSRPDKATYNKYHPYISWIPIMAFITLRNATVRLRNTSSRFYEFIGKCSLETFIGQFHMWLAADTKGLLIVLMNPSWTKSALGWWFNFAVSSVIFVFVCYYLNQTTGDITKWILSGSNNGNNSNKAATTSNNNTIRLPEQQNENEQDVPLLPTSNVDNDKGSGQPEEQGMLQTADEEWGEATTTTRPSRWNWLSRLWGDLRVKSLVFLLAVGLFNKLC